MFSSLLSHLIVVFFVQFVVLLDYKADSSLKDAGLTREITSRIQKLRKEVRILFVAFFCIRHLFLGEIG